jgi:uncharacterized protein
MAKIGERATLTILREETFGIFLDAGPLGEVLLPRREMPKTWAIGGQVDVFLYRDSEDRPVATLKQPLALPGHFAYLKVIEITPVGAFLDWGLPKDLLLPFREQRDRLEVGNSYVVHVYLDPESERIVATRRLSRHLDRIPPSYDVGQAVDLLIYGKTELGYKAIINGLHTGVIYANQVFRRIRAGERTRGYITLVRPDGKIDISLEPPGRERINSLESSLIQKLTAQNGFLPLTDETPAEEIHKVLGVSKKAFKQAVGALFRKRQVELTPEGIRLIQKDTDDGKWPMS